MAGIYNIEDHQCWSCDCGSVKFNLLRSSKIECAACGMVLDWATWGAGAGMEAGTEAGSYD
jgi:hypothetical protein